MNRYARNWCILLVLVSISRSAIVGVNGAEVGDIATVRRHNGEILGPYRVRELHSDYDDGGMAALPLVSDEGEGSGANPQTYDDTEPGEDVLNPWDNAIPDAVLTNTDDREIITPNTDQDIVEPPSNPDVRPLPEVIKPGNTDKPEIPVVPEMPVAPPIKLPDAETTRSTRAAVVPTADPTCHENCVTKIHESFTLDVSPNVSMIETGETLELTCQVAESLEGNMQTVELQWLFEGASSPRGECRLDKPGDAEEDQYLKTCTDFPSVGSSRDTNGTHLTYTLTLQGLTQDNTGHYICQVVSHCCGTIPHTQKRHYLTVWYADYTKELLVLGGLAVGLSVLFISGLIYQRRQAILAKRVYEQMIAEPKDQQDKDNWRHRIQPLPQEETSDEDSFDEYSE